MTENVSEETLSTGSTRRRAIRTAVQLAGGAVLVTGVLWTVGFKAIADAVLGADPVLLGLAVLVVQAQILASAWRWRFTAGRLGLAIPFGTAAAEYYLSSLLNMVLPGGVAGDALRALRSRGAAAAGRSRAAISAVVLERASGQIAFAVLAVAGILVWAVSLAAPLPRGSVAAVAVVPLALAGVGVAASALRRSGPARLRDAIGRFVSDIRAGFGTGRSLAVQAGLSLAIGASYVGVFALCAAAVGSTLPLPVAAAVIPLVLLSMLLPVTVGGWGLREGAAAVLWPTVGLPAADGAAAAALYGLVAVVGALPGVLSLARRRA
ncbi:lysylphosphatidylglycerol synthase transmembrane domain-containing protein [Chthonobacter albigriseus]|uniref:lysylphosphatidylglycerol synthase transmembrane domain-containing protein n=1 Tax=Chthonobacter albigriseus TaxID=1683161 RepID=UPI0015EE749A|nr:lysylphosphatidylglycerol synthase transmembrane domain-containing protein [Chthonobacter albigriseus]